MNDLPCQNQQIPAASQPQNTKPRQEYFQRNQVEICLPIPTLFQPCSGTLDYEVDLERDNDSLVYSCDCPFFEDHLEVCKHVGLRF